MAVVTMQKMSLIAHASEEARLMKLFLNAGYVEIVTKELFELTKYPDTRGRKAAIESKILKLSFALTFLKEAYNQQKIQLKKDEKQAAKEKKATAKAEKQLSGKDVISSREQSLDEKETSLSQAKPLISNAETSKQETSSSQAESLISNADAGKQETSLSQVGPLTYNGEKLTDKQEVSFSERNDEMLSDESFDNKKFGIEAVRKYFKKKNEENPYALPKVSFKKENRLVKLEEYEEYAKDEIEIFATISDMEEINSFLVDIKSEKAREKGKIEQYLPYEGADIKFSDVKDTKYTVSFLGLVPSAKAVAFKESAEKLSFVQEFEGKQLKPFFVMCHVDKQEELKLVLSEFEFARCTFTDNATAKEVIADSNGKLDCLEVTRKSKLVEAMNFLDEIFNIKVLYDSYMLELAKISCMEKSPKTKKAFVMEGWVPADSVEELTKSIEENSKKTEVFFRDPLPEENPPTLTKNNKFVDSFTGITDNFGKPNYREKDPALFVALFYFLIFGIMLGDAGYGVIMSIICFGFIKIVKPVKNSGKMIMMFGFCGISTIVWGALFGSWFGVTPEKTFLRYFTWFNPMEQPLMLFVVSLAVGLLHIGVGFMLKGVAEIKAKRALHGIFSQFSWVVIFIGIFCMFPKLMMFLGAIKPNPVPEWFSVISKVGMYIALGGVIMLIIGGAIGKRNPLKMVGGALGNLYGGVNVISDLLSYSRLFGLGLTSGVIGYALNTLGVIIVTLFFKGSWVGWLFAMPILIFGHTFNLAINLLGAYVHNSRLQYIEFFGRFYEGSGHAFNPIGSKTKYTYLDN